MSTITQQITLFPVILLTFFFHTHASSVKVIGSKNNIFNFNLILIYVVNYIIFLYYVRSKSIVYKRFYDFFFSINK